MAKSNYLFKGEALEWAIHGSTVGLCAWYNCAGLVPGRVMTKQLADPNSKGIMHNVVRGVVLLYGVKRYDVCWNLLASIVIGDVFSILINEEGLGGLILRQSQQVSQQ